MSVSFYSFQKSFLFVCPLSCQLPVCTSTSKILIGIGGTSISNSMCSLTYHPADLLIVRSFLFVPQQWVVGGDFRDDFEASLLRCLVLQVVTAVHTEEEEEEEEEEEAHMF